MHGQTTLKSTKNSVTGVSC